MELKQFYVLEGLLIMMVNLGGKDKIFTFYKKSFNDRLGRTTKNLRFNVFIISISDLRVYIDKVNLSSRHKLFAALSFLDVRFKNED